MTLATRYQLVELLVFWASLTGVLEGAVKGTVAIVLAVEIVSHYLPGFVVYLLRFADFSSGSYLQVSLYLFDVG